MADLLKLIETTFGKTTLQFVAIVILLYSAVAALSRLYQSLRTLSSKRLARERTKSELEILKLRYEIEALRREHGLEDLGLPQDEAPEPDEAAHLDAVTSRLNILDNFTRFLLNRGKIGLFLAYALFALLQLIGWFAAGFVVYVLRYFIFLFPAYPEELKTNEIYIPIAVAIVGTAALYGSFRPMGRLLRRRSTMTFHCVIAITAALAAVVTIYALILQE